MRQIVNSISLLSLLWRRLGKEHQTEMRIGKKSYERTLFGSGQSVSSSNDEDEEERKQEQQQQEED